MSPRKDRSNSAAAIAVSPLLPPRSPALEPASQDIRRRLSRLCMPVVSDTACAATAVIRAVAAAIAVFGAAGWNQPRYPNKANCEYDADQSHIIPLSRAGLWKRGGCFMGTRLIVTEGRNIFPGRRTG